ncbi:MAG: hypothetical protein HYT12_01700 [Candidatus Liptonbacteria bacterium]|nr:hypothetical protein [Candidatus Liptonbacteria bacterium]
MRTLLLIDANALIHRAFHALPPLTAPDGRPAHAIYGLSSILLKIWRDERPDYVAALFDRPEPTLRKQEYKEYKAQRPKAANELIAQIIEAHHLFAAFGVKIFEVPGYEADDLIGAAAEKFKDEPDLKIIILTGDLDALQLVYKDKIVVKTLKTGISNTVVYDEKAVIERYGLAPQELPDYKALVGDASDNIPGLPGVGPKTTTALLQKYHTIENLYESLDNEPKIKEKFETYKKDAVLYKRLATINRKAPLAVDNLEELKSRELSPKLTEYFKSFGFGSLLKRIGAEEMATAAPREEPANLFSQNKTNKEDGVFILNTNDILNRKNDLMTDKTKIGFYLKDLVKTARGKDIAMPGPYFDLGVGFWLLDPDYKKYDPESVFSAVGGSAWGGKKFSNHGWHNTEEDLQIAYQFLKREIDKRGLQKIFEGIEMPLIDILAGMERAGIKINKTVLQKLFARLEEEAGILKEKIYKSAGKKLNINSPKQLSELLFEVLKISSPKIKRTPTGLRSTDEEALSSLRGSHPIIDLILQYREIFKLESTYVKPILEFVASDGRLHTEYIQTGTATGRLSSENPNLQNIPVAQDTGGGDRGWLLRSAFVADTGFTFVAFDYSQIELRVLASVAEDEKMIQTFIDGKDIHAATAATVFHVPLPDVTPEMRRIAKTLNFGIIYGMGATSFARNAGLKRDEARRFIENYFQEFQQIKNWQEKTIQEARSAGFVKNENGRIRNVAALRLGAFRAASEAERITINMPIQSLGADIIKLAMINTAAIIKSNFKNGEVRMLLSIHDELLFEIRDDIIKEASELIYETMSSVYKLKVPLIVNMKSGKNWGDLKEL